MDNRELLKKMYEIDPTSPKEDLQRLTQLAESTGIFDQPTDKQLMESAETQPRDEMSDFLALAGVDHKQTPEAKQTITEAYDSDAEAKMSKKDARKKALQDIQMDPNTAKDPELKKELMKSKAKESIAESKEEKMPSKAHIKKMCADGKTKKEICDMHPNCDQGKLKKMIDDCKKEIKESVVLEDAYGEVIEAKSAAQKKAQEKFKAMVKGKKGDDKDSMDESSAKPDYIDIDKDGDKKEPMKKAVKDKEAKKKKTNESDERSLCHSKDHDCATVVDHPKWGLGKPVYESHAIPTDNGYVEWYDVEFKHGVEKKVPANEMKVYKMAEHGATPKKKKKAKESTAPKFIEMMKLVKESGGQQAIDPMDDILWNWANKVAKAKVEESNKQEIFAAMVYERNGGRFEMYDVVEKGLTEGKTWMKDGVEMCPEACCGKPVTECSCGPDCKHCDCNK